MMAGINVRMQLLGMQELSKKLEPGQLLGKPIRNLLSKAALIVEKRAKEKASGRPGPRVQTGRLRSSITSKVDPSAIPQWAEVGSNVFYAPFVELGHMTRGGGMAPAYPFLHPALKESQGKVNGLLEQASKEIEGNFK